MRKKLFRKPSPAMVIACLALFIALGGVSYAAISIPNNSVGTAQLKTNAVVSNKVKNHSLKASDFAQGQLPQGEKGDIGPQGLQGLKGLTGTPGATGATGATGLTGVKGDTGLQGPIGLTGVKGDKGDAGLQGSVGATGLTGAVGATGIKGDKGDTGSQGSAGATGIKGDKGDTGATGPSDAYQSFTVVRTPAPGGDWVVVVEKTLSIAGSYVLMGTLTVDSTIIDSDIGCALQVSAGNYSSTLGIIRLGPDPGFVRSGTLSTMGQATNVPAGASVQLRCSHTSGPTNQLHIQSAQVTAIHVDTLH